MLHPETRKRSHGLDGRAGVTDSIVVGTGAAVEVVVAAGGVVPGKSNCFFVVNFQIGRLAGELVTGDEVVVVAVVVVGMLDMDVTTVGEYIKPLKLVAGLMVVDVLVGAVAVVDVDVVVVGDTTGGKEILCTVDGCASGNLAVAVTIVTDGTTVDVAGDMELETVPLLLLKFAGESTAGGKFFKLPPPPAAAFGGNDNVPVDGNDVSPALEVWTLSSLIDATVDEDTLEVT